MALGAAPLQPAKVARPVHMLSVHSPELEPFIFSSR
jgi:hypothetical protein